MIVGAFSGLLDSTELQIEGEPSVEQALFIWKDSAAEFADCLIGMRHLELGCQATASFDQRALSWRVSSLREARQLRVLRSAGSHKPNSAFRPVTAVDPEPPDELAKIGHSGAEKRTI